MHALAARWYPERRFWVSKLKPAEIKKILAREASIEPDQIRIDDTPVDVQEYRQERRPATIDIGASAPSVSESAEERARDRYLRIGEWILRRRKDEVISLPARSAPPLLSKYPSNCSKSTTKFSLTTA
jgi:hypothetical protein